MQVSGRRPREGWRPHARARCPESCNGVVESLSLESGNGPEHRRTRLGIRASCDSPRGRGRTGSWWPRTVRREQYVQGEGADLARETAIVRHCRAVGQGDRRTVGPPRLRGPEGSLSPWPTFRVERGTPSPPFVSGSGFGLWPLLRPPCALGRAQARETHPSSSLLPFQLSSVGFWERYAPSRRRIRRRGA
jgi:hypothetical protein